MKLVRLRLGAALALPRLARTRRSEPGDARQRSEGSDSDANEAPPSEDCSATSLPSANLRRGSRAARVPNNPGNPPTTTACRAGACKARWCNRQPQAPCRDGSARSQNHSDESCDVPLFHFLSRPQKTP